MEDVLIDPHSPVWEVLVEGTSEDPEFVPTHTPHTTHEYTVTTTYSLGRHERTRTHRVISTFNPQHHITA